MKHSGAHRPYCNHVTFVQHQKILGRQAVSCILISLQTAQCGARGGSQAAEVLLDVEFLVGAESFLRIAPFLLNTLPQKSLARNALHNRVCASIAGERSSLKLLLCIHGFESCLLKFCTVPAQFKAVTRYIYIMYIHSCAFLRSQGEKQP